MTDTLPYYRRRAQEYEQIWHRDDPVRQGEQAAIVAVTQEIFRGRRVLEVACGTGYWTTFLARTVAYLCAVDAAPEVLELARAKNLPADRVQFREADAFQLESVPGDFNAGMANFWLSHVPKARVTEFLQNFHARLKPGSAIFLADNMNVPGLGGELVQRPGCADTFKLRTLTDGSQHEVLKNYYTREQLQNVFAPHATDVRIHIGQCFWWVRYVISERGLRNAE